jgi:hypothetical protein
MYAGEMREIIARDMALSLCVEGIYARDTLPTSKTTQVTGHGLIVNSSLKYGIGKHWIAMYFNTEDGIGEFYDPLAQFPEHYGEEFTNYFTNNCTKPLYNTKVLQDSHSAKCGHHCVYYLSHRVRGISMHEILTHFSLNSSINDIIVQEYIDGIKFN